MEKKTNTVAFSNLIGSVVFLAVGVWAWVKASGFQQVNDTYVQPAMFPQIMAGGLILFSAALLIQSVWKLVCMKLGDPFAEKSASLNAVSDKGVRAALVTIALCIAYVALFRPLGYVLDSAIVCAVIMYLIGKRNWLTMTLVSIFVPVGMWLLFYLVLQVNIPMGPLGFLRDLMDTIF